MGFYDNLAYAIGHMSYLANHARQTVTLTISNGNGVIGTQTGAGEDGNIVPWSRTLDTPVNYALASNCGLVANGATQHEAWMEGLVGGGTIEWGRKAGASFGNASLGGCPSPTPPASGGPASKEDDYQICFYNDLYAADGRYLGREELGCQPL